MSNEIAILGAGMHPWGKWGHNFVQYGVAAAREALKDAGVPWQDVTFVSGGATVRCGYPGYVAGATFAQALGWQGAEVNTSYAACASGSQALAAARNKILAGQCDVALVVGADTTPKGFLAPAKGYRPEDPDWVRFYLGITNPTYFALYARRRMDLYGDTLEDFAAVKVKNSRIGSKNPRARYRKCFTAEDVAASAMVADPLRLMDICATSDGGAALIVSSLEYAEKIGKGDAPRVAAISTTTPTFASSVVEMPDIATDSAAAHGYISNDKAGQVARRLRHPDRRVRMKAQLELGKRGAVTQLTKVAGDPEQNRFARMHAIWGLGHVGRSTSRAQKRARVLKALPPLLEDQHPDVRAAVVTVMGDLGDQQFADSLIAALADPAPRVRAVAGIAIGKLETSRAVQPLVSLLASNNDQDVVIRHGGVMGLVGSATAEQLVDLAEDSRRSVRLAAVLALRRHRSPGLAQFLQDTDSLVVREASQAIHDLPVEQAMSSLAQLADQPVDDEPLMRRVLNANFRVGDDAAATAVADVITSAAVSDVIKLEAVDMLQSWGEPSSRDRVLGMWRPLDARSHAPAVVALRKVVQSPALDQQSPRVAVATARAAATLGIDEARGMIRQLALNTKVMPSDRAEMLRALQDLGDEGMADLVEQALQDDAALIRGMARNLLLELDRDRALEELGVASKSGTTLERQLAFASLIKHVDQDTAREAVVAAGAELLAGRLPTELRLDVYEAAKAFGLDQELASSRKTLASQPYGEKSLAIAGGDVERGKQIFMNNITLSCLRCHRVGEEGGRVGPNLAGIGKEKTPEYILESLADPNKKIAEGFGSLVVVTEDGMQKQGVVQKETADLIHLVDAEGNRFFVVKEELIARKDGKSAMPEDLLKTLSNFELRDLVAYLTSLKTPWVEEEALE